MTLYFNTTWLKYLSDYQSVDPFLTFALDVLLIPLSGRGLTLGLYLEESNKVRHLPGPYELHP